jgi:hypothetical protein
MSVFLSLRTALAIAVLYTACGCRSPGAYEGREALDTQGGWQETTMTIRGKEYRLSLSQSRLATAPTWRSGGAEEPRLLPGQAVLRARRELGRHFSDAGAWTIDRITLDRAAWINAATGMVAESDQWYYDVSFRTPESTPPHSHSYRVWVLLDGTVVAATAAAQVEPAGPANGSQPLSPETNRTSSPAGSRR